MTKLLDQPPHALTAEERRAIDASMEAAKRGDFATEKEVAAILIKHGF